MSVILLFLLLMLAYKFTAVIALKGRRVSGEIFHQWSLFSFYMPWYASVIMSLMIYYLFPSTLNYTVTAIAGFFFCVAIVIRFFAFKELKELSYPHIRIKKNHALIKSGLFRYIRHPIYLSDMISVFCVPLFFNVYVALIFAFLMIPGLIIRIETEEEVLSEHVKGYKKYVKRTKKLIPFVW